MAEATLNPLATVVAGVHHLFFAPLGTTLPTVVGSAPGQGLDDAFTAVGYTADTGAAFAVDTQTTNLFASQSLDPIRTIVQSKTATIQAPLIEWSASSLTAAFGGGTITAATGGWKYVPPAAGTLDDRRQVQQALPRLLGRGLPHQLTGPRIQRDLARAEQQAARRHGVDVRADRRRCTGDDEGLAIDGHKRRRRSPVVT